MSKKVVKSNHNSTIKPKSTKVRQRSYCHYGEYTEAFTGRTISMSSNFFEYLADRLGNWIQDLSINGLAKHSSFTIEEFLMESKIPWSTLDGWRTKSPVLDSAYKHAIQCLGVLRESAALYGKLNPNMVAKVQHFYLPSCFQAHKSYEELKKPVTVIQSSAQIQQQGIEKALSFVDPIVAPQ